MSSARQTDPARSGKDERTGAGEAKEGREFLLWLVWLAPLLAGWLFILKIQSWHFGPSAYLLFAGWLAVLLSAVFLLQAGLAAASGSGEGEEGFGRPGGRRAELLREKKALLKALKEIEFDHQMGKMSDEDAASISRFYRARAIEILKLLEGREEAAGARTARDDGGLSPRERIERDVAARLEAGLEAGRPGDEGAEDEKPREASPTGEEGSS